MSYIFESKKTSVSFIFKENPVEIESTGVGPLYFKVTDWAYINGFKFPYKSGPLKLLSIDEVNDKLKTVPSYAKSNISRDFNNVGDSGKYLIRLSNADKNERAITRILTDFGARDIKTEGFELRPFRIKRFGDKDVVSDIELDELDEPVETEIEEIKVFSKNPFRQSICVLGESGAGKSTTLEHILEFEGHEFEFIIPSASTTGLLSQFSPSRSGYIPSRLGKMIVEAFSNPTTLYTAVFDECHKSNVIEMINDELLQAISTKRNMGKRFISLDEDTSELYKGVDTFRGNILIPDNFGFIFISSKPRIIANNTDFFNRVELVLLTEADRDMSTSDELLSKVLPEEEKMKLASTRND